VDVDALRSTAERVERVARTRYPAFYGGVAIDEECQAVILYRRPNPAMDAELSSAARGSQLILREARFARGDLDRLSVRIRADTAALRDEGVDVVTVGVAASAQGVEVGVRRLTDDVADRLVRRYGDAVIVREGPDPVLLPFPLPSGN
jgi:hypothetical protein